MTVFPDPEHSHDAGIDDPTHIHSQASATEAERARLHARVLEYEKYGEPAQLEERLRITEAERARLHDQMVQLTARYVDLERQVGEARVALSKWTDRGEPSFDGAYLTTWHKNIGFLQDAHFLKAYQAGMETGFISPENDPINLRLHWRTATACWAAAHAKNLEGDFVECGVNTGILSVSVCEYINIDAESKSFYLFDTYDGIPVDQMSARDKSKGLEDYNAYYPECYELAVHNFNRFKNAKVIKGKVPDILHQHLYIEKVCYLSLDMNIALPERAAIEFFWDKLSSGAPVVLDDYAWNDYAEQKQTLDEFASMKRVEILTLPTGQGLILKP